MDAHTYSTIARYSAATIMLLGAQARLFPHLIPHAGQVAKARSEGFRMALSFIPSSNATQHSRIIGMMCAATGVLLLIPRRKLSSNSRVRFVLEKIGDLMAVVIPCMFTYAHLQMGDSPSWAISSLVLDGIMFWGA